MNLKIGGSLFLLLVGVGLAAFVSFGGGKGNITDAYTLVGGKREPVVLMPAVAGDSVEAAAAETGLSLIEAKIAELAAQVAILVKQVDEIRPDIIIDDSGPAANVFSGDSEFSRRLSLLERQLDSDRDNFSLGQVYVLPQDLVAKTLGVGGAVNHDNFTVDDEGNVEAQDIAAAGNLSVQGSFSVSGAQTYSGAAEFTANSTVPALQAVQNGAGLALQADDLTFKDKTIGSIGGIINLNGDIGIGTTLPDAQFEVRSAADYSGGGFQYQETVLGSSSFEETGVAQGWNYDEYDYSYTLPFSFPFYGDEVTEIQVSTNGLLWMCADCGTRWSYDPGLEDVKLNPVIAPLWGDWKTDGIIQSGEDIYIDESVTGQVTIRWKGEKYQGLSGANFSVTLYSNGNVAFKYGDGNEGMEENYHAFVAISSGDGINYTISKASGNASQDDAVDRSFVYAETAAVGLNKVFNAGSSGNNYFTVLNNGNVGIGIANPESALDISSTDEWPSITLRQFNREVLTISSNGNNLFTGAFSGKSSTTGDNNSAFGNYALYSNSVGEDNSAFGQYALYSNVSGTVNTAFGFESMYSNLNGTYNNAFGYDALYSNTSGYDNTAIGDQALYDNTSGYYNVALGSGAAYLNTTGYDNVVGGPWAMYANSTGIRNIVIGKNSLNNTINGNYNTVIGYAASTIKPSISSALLAAGGAIDSGRHEYIVTYVINGIEHPSDVKRVYPSAGTQTANLSGISVYAGPQTITAKRLYRTVTAGGATATATVANGAVTAVTLTNGGSGYGSTAVVTLSSTSSWGSGAVVTATGIVDGVIQQSNLTVTNGGSGYDTAPVVAISKYPSNNSRAFYKVADLDLAATTYSDSASDVDIITNGTLPAGITNSIVLGANALATGSNQFVIGSSSNLIYDSYFGGVYRATSGGGYSHTIHAMGGYGNNAAGGSLTFAGGQGTGTGLGGALIFQTAPATVAGSLANPLVERMRIDSLGNVGIGTAAPAQRLDIQSGALRFSYMSAPGALTAALAGAGGGNLSNGAYKYKVTYVNGIGESAAGTASGTVTVVDNTSNGQIALTNIPVSADPTVTSRKIYRTIAGGSTYLLAITIANNTSTSIVDNIADASLGAAAPSISTVSGGIFAGTTRVATIDSNGNVGIGTTAPSVLLHAIKSGATVAAFNRTTNDGTIVSLQQDGTEEGTISVAGNTISYNAFTGSHYAWSQDETERGTLVSLTGTNKYLHDNPESEIIYGVTKSGQQNDSKVLGVVLGLQEPELEPGVDNPLLVAAVGNVDALVIDTGNNIEIGDYLVSSSIPGFLELESATSTVSNVVARALEPVGWDDATSTLADGTAYQTISVSLEFSRHYPRLSLDANGLIAGTPEEESSSGIADIVKNALSSLGLALHDGVASLKELVVGRFTADIGRVKKMEMIDEDTGEIYCTWIKGGEWIKTKGECNSAEEADPNDEEVVSGDYQNPGGNEGEIPPASEIVDRETAIGNSANEESSATSTLAQ